MADSTIGTKRKRNDVPKFYAVRAGYTPGVYHTYAECLQQVKGFKSASFKAFPNLSEAEAFVKHGLIGSRGSTKFYAVRSGRVPGIYHTWDEAKQQIDGWANPQHKSFFTLSEAEAFLNTKPDVNGGSRKQRKVRDEYIASGELSEDVEPGTGLLPAGSEDGFDYRLKLNNGSGKLEYKTEEERTRTKMHPVGVSKDTMLHIYTDGSTLSNGQLGAVAGFGVYFGPNDSRNVSERLGGDRQTNQRAELAAIKRAIDLTPRDRDVKIFSDSQYSIKCVTEWFQNWRRNGWLNASKKPVENKDLIEPIINKIDERHRLGVKTTFQWIKGHADDAGNVAADRLAVEGASKPQSEQD